MSVDATLRQMRELAQDRDSLAHEYATGFEMTFGLGCEALSENWRAGFSLPDSVPGQEEVARFDDELRDESNALNPGTTADLVTACLFVFLIEHGMPGCASRLIARR